MTNSKINTSNSNIYNRLAAARMTASERANAISAFEEGEKIAAVILSVAHFLRLLVATPALKPNFKHSARIARLGAR